MQLRSLLVLAGLAAMASAQAGVIADLAGDFDASNNPGLTNNWAYGYSTVSDGSDFVLYDSNTSVSATYGAANATGWSAAGSPTGVYPYVAKNLQNWTYGGSVNFTAGSVIMHPGNANSHLYSIARYTAASGLGNVRLDTLFQRLESGGSSTYGVFLNGTLVPGFGGTIAGTGTAFGPSNTNLFLNAGDRLDFILGPGNDSFGGDVNAVSATLSSVPGPGAALAFGIGLLRRRRKA